MVIRNRKYLYAPGSARELTGTLQPHRVGRFVRLCLVCAAECHTGSADHSSPRHALWGGIQIRHRLRMLKPDTIIRIYDTGIPPSRVIRAGFERRPHKETVTKINLTK